MFSAIYVQRVLEPSYHNWRKFLIPEFFRVQRAHLVMLAECGILNSAAVVALKKGIDTIEQEFQFPEEIPTGMEDLYFVFEHELAQRIGSEQAGRLHTARSRNDMDTTVPP
jgi:argininosuccinate lyase